MNIEGTLTELKGNQFEYNGEMETLHDWRYANGLYTLSTSKKERRMDVTRLRDFLEGIVGENQKKGVAILGKQESSIVESVNSSFSDVKAMILKNMQTLNGKTFTPQDLERAKATNEGAKVLIDMAKVQVDMVKELRK